MAVAACVTPIVTRLIGPGPFGRVAAGMAVMQVLYCFESLGLAVAVQRVHAEGPDGERHSRSLLSVALLSTAVMTIVLVGTSNAWGGALGFSGTITTLRIALAWGGTASATAVFKARLRSEDRVLSFSLVSVVEGLVAQLMALGAVLIWQRTATVYLGAIVAGQALALVCGVVASPPRIAGVLAHRRNLAILAFALPLIPEQLASFVLNTSDRLIVQSRLGPVALGRYSLAYNLAGTGAVLLVMFNVVWLPDIFSAAPGRRRAEVLARTRDRLLRMALPTMLGIALGAPAVLTVWAPSSFRPDGLVTTTTLVALTTLPALIYTSEYRVLVAAGRTKTVALATCGCAVLNVSLNLILVPVLGLNGSALATVVSYGALAVVAHLLARSATTLRPVSRGLRGWALAASGLTAASALAPAGGTWFAVRLLLGACCLGPLLRALRHDRAQESSPAIALLRFVPSRARLEAILRESVVLPLATLAAVLSVTRSSGIDNAYITYRYSASLLAGHGLTFNPAQRVEGISDPIWAVLLSGAHLLGLSLPTAGSVLGVACLVAVVVIVRAIGRQMGLGPSRNTLLATGVAGTVPLAASATMGLEGGLFAAGLLLLVYTWHRPGWAAAGFAASTVVLAATRPEGLIIAVGITALNAGLRPRRKSEVLAAGATALGLIAFVAWQWDYYGHPIATSVTAKRDLGSSPLTTLGANAPAGIRYDAEALEASLLIAGVVVIAYGLQWARHRPARRALPPEVFPATLLTLFGLGVPLFTGGDWMPYSRLVAPYLPVMTVALVGTATVIAGRVGRAAPALPLLLAIGVTPLSLPLQDGGSNPVNAERGFDYVGRALSQTGLGRQAVATDVLGRVSFWAPQVTFEDMYGLTDPVLAAMPGPGGVYGKLDLRYSASLQPAIVASNDWWHDRTFLRWSAPGRYVAVTAPALTAQRIFLLARPGVAASFTARLREWFPGAAIEQPAAAISAWQALYPTGQ